MTDGLRHPMEMCGAGGFFGHNDSSQSMTPVVYCGNCDEDNAVVHNV